MNEIDNRAWGMFEVLLDEKYTKVKKIFIKPGQKLSYQSHTKRDEMWIVVEGILTIIIDGKEHNKSYGQSIQIPMGSKHRAVNKTSKPVIFIEVQTGKYFGEDDIVRYEI
tara:strand:+ start:436 stop:765 length:330 start_codon:yes stop_codon:yes gene_type:complete